MEFVPAKAILQRHKNPDSWFGNDYGMNLYKGCCHGCIYCDSRSDCYQVEDFDRVRGKEHALVTLEKELRSKRKTGLVGTGAMSDPYNPLEKQYELTRGSLTLLDVYGFGIQMITKSSLVRRDIDLLQRIRRHSPVSVSITITAAEDSIARIIEPHAPPSSERFAALKALTDHGMVAGVAMMPILPFITDTPENIVSIIEKTAAAGGRHILPWFAVTLRAGQREYFYNKLDIHFPGIKEKYMRTYGGQYECRSPRYGALEALFRKECERYGITYTMQGIIQQIKNSVEPAQLSLF